MSLIGIIREGDIIGAVEKIGQLIKDEFTNDVIPALESFVTQFETDFGKAALKDAAPLAITIAAAIGSGDFVSVKGEAEKLADKLLADGITIAEQNAQQVALNAIQVHLSPLLAKVGP